MKGVVQWMEKALLLCTHTAYDLVARKGSFMKATEGGSVCRISTGALGMV